MSPEITERLEVCGLFVQRDIKPNVDPTTGARKGLPQVGAAGWLQGWDVQRGFTGFTQHNSTEQPPERKDTQHPWFTPSAFTPPSTNIIAFNFYWFMMSLKLNLTEWTLRCHVPATSVSIPSPSILNSFCFEFFRSLCCTALIQFMTRSKLVLNHML